MAWLLQGLREMMLSQRIRTFLLQLEREWKAAYVQNPRVLRALVATLAVTITLSLGGGVWFLSSLWRGLPDERAIAHMGDMDQATSVYDVHDAPAFTIYKEQRIDVPLAQMSPHLTQAILAIEDQRFFEHHGVDLIRIVAATLTNIRHGRLVQGASTITQQLARQSFLKPEKTIRRKLQELILAERIEARYSKPQILEAVPEKGVLR